MKYPGYAAFHVCGLDSSISSASARAGALQPAIARMPLDDVAFEGGEPAKAHRPIGKRAPGCRQDPDQLYRLTGARRPQSAQTPGSLAHAVHLPHYSRVIDHHCCDLTHALLFNGPLASTGLT